MRKEEGSDNYSQHFCRYFGHVTMAYNDVIVSLGEKRPVRTYFGSHFDVKQVLNDR